MRTGDRVGMHGRSALSLSETIAEPEKRSLSTVNQVFTSQGDFAPLVLRD
jgi:hypothetical protein